MTYKKIVIRKLPYMNCSSRNRIVPWYHVKAGDKHLHSKLHKTVCFIWHPDRSTLRLNQKDFTQKSEYLEVYNFFKLIFEIYVIFLIILREHYRKSTKMRKDLFKSDLFNMQFDFYSIHLGFAVIYNWSFSGSFKPTVKAMIVTVLHPPRDPACTLF